MKCPKCKSECICDEVDIGVGTLEGNCCCEKCGWTQNNYLDSPLTDLKD